MSRIYCSKCNAEVANDSRYTLEDYKWYELGDRGYCSNENCKADLSVWAVEH